MSRKHAKVLAIIGTALTGLFAAASVASIWWEASWLFHINTGADSAGLWWSRGSIGGWTAKGTFVGLGSGPMTAYGVHLHSLSDPTPMIVQRRAPAGARGYEVPLWIPLILAATPTVFVIRAALRPGPGRCKSCGYDLTGVRGLVCPECGAEFNR